MDFRMLRCSEHHDVDPKIELSYADAVAEVHFDNEFNQMLIGGVQEGQVTYITVKCGDPNCHKRVYRHPGSRDIPYEVRRTITYWNQENATPKI